MLIPLKEDKMCFKACESVKIKDGQCGCYNKLQALKESNKSNKQQLND